MPVSLFTMNTESTYSAKETFPNRYPLQLVIPLLTSPQSVYGPSKNTENIPKKVITK